jgi:hypothetical protein
MTSAFASNEIEQASYESEDAAKAWADRVMNQWVEDNTHGWRSPFSLVASGSQRIDHERQRQIHQEGWTEEDDDGYLDDELIRAALCYAALTTARPPFNVQGEWPWDFTWLKPSDDLIRNLVKAGALIAAEIDRRLRAKEQAERRAS